MARVGKICGVSEPRFCWVRGRVVLYLYIKSVWQEEQVYAQIGRLMAQVSDLSTIMDAVKSYLCAFRGPAPTSLLLATSGSQQIQNTFKRSRRQPIALSLVCFIEEEKKVLIQKAQVTQSLQEQQRLE